MHVCLLTTQDLEADPFPEDDWPCDPRPFLPAARWELAVLEKPSAVATVTALARKGFDLFFNLCDGAWDEQTPGIEVVQALERLEVPFTGATSEFYEPTRDTMKRVCHAWGIDTPAYVVARTAAEVERAAQVLRFPMFVKHPSSYASVGLTRDSRVTTVDALRRQAHKMMEAHGGALVEEFIEGTECTVLVAENPDDPQQPTTYTPLQYRFPDGESFKHADMKWVDYDALQSFPVQDADLAARLRGASARFFLGLNGAGYGRCDLRVDADGRPFMLEINPNCGLYYPASDPGSADLILARDPAGHEGFTRQVVEAALRRHARASRCWTVRPGPDGALGLFARRAIRAGERILAFEERPHDLVSRAWVQRHWDDRRTARFAREAWPLTGEVWVVWPRDAKDWRPVRHACDPNAWWAGLDIVARRDVAAGEEITLDYATFRTAPMPEFTCSCGAADCRGTIRADDHQGAFVARYGEHVSEYVRGRRAGDRR